MTRFTPRIQFSAFCLASSLALAGCGDSGSAASGASTTASAASSAASTSQTIVGSLPTSAGTADTAASTGGGTATTTATTTTTTSTSTSSGATSSAAASSAATTTSTTATTSTSTHTTVGTVTTSQVADVNYGEALVAWSPPNSNTDGTLLTDLTGFNIYFGKDPSNLDNVVALDCSWCLWTKVMNLGPGTWYFGVRSYNRSGTESPLSQVMSKTIG